MMKKRLLALSLIAVLLFGLSLPASAIPFIPERPEKIEQQQPQPQQVPAEKPAPVVVSNISVYLDGKQLAFDSKPVVINGTTLVPMRTIFEALGMDVCWYENSQTILSERSSLNITLKIGSKYAYKNQEEITLLEPPRLINGRTMVPLRFIAEAADCTVEWNGEDAAVAINSPAASKPAVPEATAASDNQISFEPQSLMLPCDCYTFIPVYFEGGGGHYRVDVADPDLLFADWDGEWQDGRVWLYLEPQDIGKTTVTVTLRDKNNKIVDQKQMQVSVGYSTILGTYYEGFAPAVNLGQLLDLLPVGHYLGAGEDAGCEGYYYDWSKLSSSQLQKALGLFDQELKNNGFDFVGNVSDSDEYETLEYVNIKHKITLRLTAVSYSDGSGIVEVLLYK